jgi:ankyrin repeat protein
MKTLLTKTRVSTSSGRSNSSIAAEFRAIANIEARDKNRQTALCLAAARGLLPQVRLLCSFGAAADARCRDDVTPTMLAAQHNHVACVAFFEQQDKANGTHRDVRGWTTLTHAVHNSAFDVLAALVEHQKQQQQQQMLSSSWIDPHDLQGRTPLSLACAVPHDASYDMAEYLLEHRANRESQDNFGWTPLIAAVRSGSARIVDMLVDAGAYLEQKDRVVHQTPLLFAVARADVAIARRLLTARANVRVRDKNGWSVLHHAVFRAGVDMVELLLAHSNSTNGSSSSSNENNKEEESKQQKKKKTQQLPPLLTIEVRDAFGWTPLMSASRAGNTTVVHLLLKLGADANAVTRTGGWTPLCAAARSGWHDVVSLLLEAQASMYAKTSDGNDALKHAQIGKHTLIVDMLVKARLLQQKGLAWVADPTESAAVSLLEARKRSAGFLHEMHRARKQQQHNDAKSEQKELLPSGAQMSSYYSTRMVVNDDDVLVNDDDDDDDDDDSDASDDDDGGGENKEGGTTNTRFGGGGAYNGLESQTALTVAARDGEWAIVRLLCSEDSYKSQRARAHKRAEYNAALAIAAARGHARVVRELLKMHATDDVLKLDIGTPDLSVDAKQQRTPLMHAAHARCADAVAALLHAKAHANTSNDAGRTALSVACERGAPQCVKLLIRARAHVDGRASSVDVAARDDTVLRPLMYACAAGNATSVKYLLKSKALVNSREPGLGKTALIFAVARGHRDIIKLLVQFKGNVALQDYNHWTPLMHASVYDRKDVVLDLLEAGADDAAVDAGGRNALALAYAKRLPKVVQALLQFRAEE